MTNQGCPINIWLDCNLFWMGHPFADMDHIIGSNFFKHGQNYRSNFWICMAWPCPKLGLVTPKLSSMHHVLQTAATSFQYSLQPIVSLMMGDAFQARVNGVVSKNFLGAEPPGLPFPLHTKFFHRGVCIQSFVSIHKDRSAGLVF